MIEAVLGIDPGSNTGWSVASIADHRPLAGGTLKLEKMRPAQQAWAAVGWAEGIRTLGVSLGFRVIGVTIEDVLEGATYNRKLNALGDMEAGHFRRPDSTAKLNLVAGMLIGVVALKWGMPVRCVPISEWYLRVGNKMAKKTEAIAYFRAAALRFGPETRKMLSTEHAAMAYGLARNGVTAAKKVGLIAAARTR